MSGHGNSDRRGTRGVTKGAWRGVEGLRSGRIDFRPAPAGSVEERAAMLAAIVLHCSCGWKGRADQLGDEGCPKCSTEEHLTRDEVVA